MDYFIRSWIEQQRKASSTLYNDNWLLTSLGRTHLLEAESNRSGKPDLVFLPGWASNCMYWDLNDLIRLYTPHFNVYLLDVPGQPGLSDPLMMKHWKGRNSYGYWLRSVLDELGIDQANLVGVSFGGFLVLKLAQIAPERIARAALLTPAGFTYTFRPELRHSLMAAIAPRRQHTTNFLRHVILNRQYDQLSSVSHLTDYLTYVFKSFRITSPPPHLFQEREISRLKAPSMVLCGAEDHLFNAETIVRKAQKLLPDLREVRILPNLDHALETSPETARQVLQFFSMTETPTFVR